MRVKNFQRVWMYLLVMIALLLPVAFSFSSSIPVSERDALMAFCNSSYMSEWEKCSGWKDGTLQPDGFAIPGTKCNWSSVTCSYG